MTLLSLVPMENNPRQRINRNDPCPCGSGKKYKKCHLPTETKANRPPGDHASGPSRTSNVPDYGKPKDRQGKSLFKRGSSKGKGRVNLPRRSGG
ncbi:MAG: SEC-C metal-binding domain-containing protein [Planctomycetota bacterium]|nr:SEC-C metal-binding domain-containing protein [Planctomycetota bacterium]